MRLAEISVPKMSEEDIYGREGDITNETIDEKITFCNAEEAIRASMNCAGKVLLVSDGSTIFSDAACSPRTISVVFDGDCLPLFSMPDTIAKVLASGGEELLRAARYFAEVRGIPCVLFPTDGALDGALDTKGKIFLAEEKLTVTLKEGEVLCDTALLSPTLSSSFGRLILSQLAAIEARAVAAFRHEEENFCEAEIPKELTAEEIVRANARQRVKECSCYAGEGVILAQLLRERGEKFPEWRAFLHLSSLYAAFFEKGKPRRYFTPDYRARAILAGTEYTLTGVPSAEEYVIRAMTLERIRASFAKETLALANEKEKFQRIIARLSDGVHVPLRGGDLSRLKILPEYAPNGLSAIIRDFGLMEWDL